MTRLNAEPSLIKKIILILGIALGVLFYYFFHWGSLDAFAVDIDSCDTILCDFSRYYYPMGKKILTTLAPVEGFYYSPAIALLFSLWRSQPRDSAMVSWGGVQVLSIILLSVVWLHSIQKEKFSLRALYFFLILTSVPVIHNFKWGQISLISILAVILALELYETNNKVAASFSLAFATVFKFYPVVFILYFILTGDLFFVILFGAFLFLLGIAIPALVIGLKPTISFYFAILDSTGTRFSFVTGKFPGVNSQYFPLVAMRYFGEYNNPEWLMPLQIISWLFFGFNLTLVTLIAASKLEYKLRWAFLILLASTPFYVPSAWAHYLVFLPGFQVFLAFIIERDKNRYWKYAILFISAVLSSVFFLHMFETWSEYANWGFMVVSNVLLLLLTYVEIIPQLSLQAGVNYYKNHLHNLMRKG